MNAAIETINKHAMPHHAVTGDAVSQYEQWLERHQDVLAAQVSVTYDRVAGQSCISVFLATSVGRDRTDRRWAPGDHRFCPDRLIAASRAEFVRWYTRKGVRD